MARIAIEPQPLASHFLEEQLEELARALGEQGHTVVFRNPIERRGLPMAGPGFQVALYLGEFLQEHVLEEIIGVLLSRLVPSGLPRRSGSRRAAIFGPDGKVLREVELREE